MLIWYVIWNNTIWETSEPQWQFAGVSEEVVQII